MWTIYTVCALRDLIKNGVVLTGWEVCCQELQMLAGDYSILCIREIRIYTNVILSHSVMLEGGWELSG